ncbi:MAG TPA: Hsp33 family molecular chaperone HslO [Gammaproteobacteria bacterium]
MPDNDRLYRFIIEHTNVRGEMVHLNATWQAVLQRGNYPENVRSVLGEAMAACALLAATIKFEGSLILQIRGDGPLHLLVVQTTAEGTMRAIARWNTDVPDHGLSNIFGNGQMVMTIESTEADPYQGIIALQGEHLKDAIEAYFQQSEQLDTRLWLASDENTCAGFLLQQMPKEISHDDDEDVDAWTRTVHLASTITKNELLDIDVTDMLHRLFHEEDVRLFEPEPVSFRCNCSHERIETMLVSMGESEVRQLLDEQGKIEVDCEFCNAHYEYDAIDIETLFNDASSPAPQTRH